MSKEEQNIITIEQAERWIEKFELLTSKGAKIIHVKHLLEMQHKLSEEAK